MRYLHSNRSSFARTTYSFQGQERDDEVKGNGNSYTTEFRQYDPRVGRWLSLDQKSSKYPSITPFNFVVNIPTITVDPDGKDIIIVTSNGSFKAAKEILLKTPEGNAIWNEYKNSTQVDIYIAVAPFDKGSNNIALTVFNIAGTTMISNDKIFIPNENYKEFNIFHNKDVSRSRGKKIALIVFNSNNEDGFFSDNENAKDNHSVSSGAYVYNDYDNAEAIYHEMMSHVKLNIGDNERDHNAYGNSHNGVMTGEFGAKPNSYASKIKKSLEKVYSKKISEILKFRPPTDEEIKSE